MRHTSGKYKNGVILPFSRNKSAVLTFVIIARCNQRVNKYVLPGKKVTEMFTILHISGNIFIDFTIFEEGRS